MAQLIKISELSTIPSVTGPELIPIVQGGVTDKILFSTLKNNIVATAQGLINTAVAALELEDVAINGLIDDTNTIVSGHTVTINSHTITIGDHTTSIGTLTSDVAALEVEDIAINGLIDDINIAIAAIPTDNIYTASGNLFDTGVATTRKFRFVTDSDAGYNPNNATHTIEYNAHFDVKTTGWTYSPGSYGMKVNTGLNANNAVINFYSSDAAISIEAATGVGSNRRFVTVEDDKAMIGSETGSGTSCALFAADSGLSIGDYRLPANAQGLRYEGDYSTAILVNNRSIPDVGIVKTLRQQTNTWTTGTRPAAPVAGMFGFNTTIPQFEGWNGTAWVAFA